MPRKMRDFVHFLPHCSHPRTLFRPHLAFRHRTLFASFALLIAPSALRRTLFRLRRTLCSPAFCPALLRTLPRRRTLCSPAFCPALLRTLPRRRSDVRKDTQASLPLRPCPLCTAFAYPFKRAKPLRPRRRGFSHCHVMFRRRLTPRRGRCKPAHRRRASWLQARSHPSTHSG